MAYTKQTWADLPSKNTPINATRLTHIEDGIFNAAATADNAASTAGTAAANVGIVSGKVETLTERVNGLDTAVSNKVDKVAGKGLSTNDYDDTDKGKVDSLGAASTKNSTSVVTQSTDLVESGAVKDIVGWGNKNLWKFGSFTGAFANVPFSLPAGTYTLSFNSNSDVGVRLFYNENNSVVVSGASPLTIVLEQPVVKINYSCNDSTATNVQLEKGSTATAYEPYHANVEDTLRDAEVIEAKNLLTNAYPRKDTIDGITFVIGKNTIDISGQTTNFVSTNINQNRGEDGSLYLPYGTYIVTTNSEDPNAEVFIGSTYNHIFHEITTSGKTVEFTLNANSESDFIVDGTVGIAIYAKAISNGTPINVTIHPAIYKKSEYHIPLKDVVPTKADNSVIGTVEDGTNPTKSYAVGEHFIRNGKFCTVTSPVTTSSTWTLGSNYVEGTIADLMAPLSDALTSSNGAIEASRIYTCGNLVSYMIRFKATEDISVGTNIINGVKLPAVLNSGMVTVLFTDISTGNTYRVNLDVSANIPRLKTLDVIANGTTIRGSITYISQ